MEWKVVSITEVTDLDQNGRFTRAKKARFQVNGSEHTLRISMPDFDAGKTNQLIQAEVDKIIAAYGKPKK